MARSEEVLTDEPAEARYERYRRAIAGRSLPLLLCDLDALERNARAMTAAAGGKPIRLASKSLRAVALHEHVLARPGFSGVLCMTASEAGFLASRGQRDLWVAYPTLDRAGLGAAAAASKGGARVVLTVDDPAQVDAAAEVARSFDVVLPLAIDADMSSTFPGLHFGVRRSPLRAPEEVVVLAQRIRNTRGVRLSALLCYEAQLAGLPDDDPRNPVRSAALRLLKRVSQQHVLDRRARIVETLARHGFVLEAINGGGTGSLAFTRRDPHVSELTAGSGLFAPALFDGYRDLALCPALVFALEVTRRPAPGLLTCLGGGYVASGAAGEDKLPSPYLPPGGRLLPHEGAGEVQTPVRYRGRLPLHVGDPYFFRHAKAGEVTERFDTLLLLRGDRIVGEAPTYRGEGRAFL